MRVAGIVAEYNPFHAGHAYHMAQTRLAGCTHIAVVMGGNYTQRGEGACMDEAARCEAALRGGADLLLGLPLPWAAASAETFALGAVSLLEALRCVDTLSFGSETGDLPALQSAAAELERLDGGRLRQALRGGLSFPRAREAALAGRLADPALLRRPNDILGVEYLKALRRLGSSIRPLAVRRRGAGHDSSGTGEGFASASFIRSLMAGGRWEEAGRWLPAGSLAVCRREFAAGRAPFRPEAAEPLILGQLRRMGPEDFARLPDVSEGLENRLFRAAQEATTLEGLYAAVKTKRYTLSRVRRMVLAAFLGLERSLTAAPPPYIRVLGLNGRGAEILRAARPSLPLISRHADTAALDARGAAIYARECLGADLYALCLPKRLPCGQMQRYRPLFCSGETADADIENGGQIGYNIDNS